MERNSVYYLYTKNYDIVPVVLSPHERITSPNLAPMDQQPGLTLTTPRKGHPCRATTPPPLDAVKAGADYGKASTPRVFRI